MDGISTKKNEVITFVNRYEDLTRATGLYANKAICKSWIEDFVDEDTGDVVSIERKEVLFERGTELKPDMVSQLLFYFQSGDVKEIELSNQRRGAYEATYGTRIYLAVAEIGMKKKKYKFIFSSCSIPVSMEILKDYIELNFEGGYRILSIKEFQTDIILEDSLKQVEESMLEENTLNEDKFYQITALITEGEGYEYTSNAVVKTIDLEKALVLLDRKLKERSGEQKFGIKLEEAKLVSVDYIIDSDFVLAYLPK